MQTTNRITTFLGLAEAKTDGAHAAFRNESWTSNPFAVGSRQWTAWHEGFMECMEHIAKEEREAQHRQALAEVTREEQRRRLVEAKVCDEIKVRIAGGEDLWAIEADHDARQPQPKRVGWFTWLMALVCRNFARSRVK